jgi:hypothetical protein
MKSTEIKSIIKSKFNISPRVRTGVSKNPFICVWLQNSEGKEFPIEFRAKCLRAIYGEDCVFADKGNAGNVNPKSIAMHEKEWIAVLS